MVLRKEHKTHSKMASGCHQIAGFGSFIFPRLYSELSTGCLALTSGGCHHPLPLGGNTAASRSSGSRGQPFSPCGNRHPPPPFRRLRQSPSFPPFQQPHPQNLRACASLRYVLPFCNLRRNTLPSAIAAAPPSAAAAIPRTPRLRPWQCRGNLRASRHPNRRQKNSAGKCSRRCLSF